VLSGQHTALALKNMTRDMMKAGKTEMDVPRTYRCMEVQCLRAGTSRDVCHLAAGMGQASQTGSALTTTQIMTYIAGQCAIKPPERRVLTDNELFYHLGCVGFLTREREEKAAKSRTGKPRTEAETLKALVRIPPVWG
jgi:hypothetical protein